MTAVMLLCVAAAAGGGMATDVVGATGIQCPEPIYQTFWQAELPMELWEDFAAVAGCESGLYPGAEGDGGNSIGLFQIQPSPWLRWAEENGLGSYDLYDPVDNTRLAFYIGELYDIPRHNGDRWFQWSNSPDKRGCRNWVPPMPNWVVGYEKEIVFMK